MNFRVFLPVLMKTTGFFVSLSVYVVVVKNIESHPTFVKVPRPFWCQHKRRDCNRKLIVEFSAQVTITNHSFRPVHHFVLPEKVEIRDVVETMDRPEHRTPAVVSHPRGHRTVRCFSCTTEILPKDFFHYLLCCFVPSLGIVLEINDDSVLHGKGNRIPVPALGTKGVRVYPHHITIVTQALVFPDVQRAELCLPVVFDAPHAHALLVAFRIPCDFFW
mmetsp:Transcript_93869/g.191193  ORF Transcript_93869/g.191193 Transcript_93869/m.191193 type:complete len:218 (+) Transcript_93869:1594-2247(+)